jgi:hypothetical protein
MMSPQDDEKIQSPVNKGGAPIGSQHALKHGYYAAKAAATRTDKTRLDARYRADKAILRDRRAAYQRICGRSGYTLRRREQWLICERLRRVLNKVEPRVFAQESLVNARRHIVMPLAMDYVSLVARYESALAKAFDGLPDGKREVDAMTRLQRAAERDRRNKRRQNGSGKPSDSDGVKDTEVEVVDGGGYPT